MNTKSIIEIFRGDDSDALGYQTIVGTIHTDLDLSGCKAVFRYLGFFQEFDPIPEDGKLTIVIPSASSMQFPPGLGYASLKVYDIDRKVRTFTNRIPVFVQTKTPCRRGGNFDVEFSPFPELEPLKIFKGPGADDFDLYTGFITKIIDRASAEKYGLAMLFDAMDPDKGSANGYAASPAAVKAAYDAVIQVLTDNYYNKQQTDEAIDKLAAYYITSDAQGNPFSTHSALVNAATYYSGGSVRTPTRNDYAIVLSDETHNNEEWRYIYAENAQGVGRWEPQYSVEGVITFDDYVTKTSGNGVKSSGIWSAIWGALSTLPTGFASLYDWCVSQLAGKLSTSGGTVTGNISMPTGQLDAGDVQTRSYFDFNKNDTSRYLDAPENSGKALTDADLSDSSSALGAALAGKLNTSGGTMTGGIAFGAQGTVGFLGLVYDEDDNRLRIIDGWNENIAYLEVPNTADRSRVAFMSDVGNATAAIPYTLGTPTVIDTASSETVEGETVYYGAATLDNRTANIVQVTAATALDELRITFPAATSGKVRDFGLRVEIGTGSAALTAPALVPIAPTGETIKIENNAAEIPALADGTATAKGVTLLYFSENAPGVFVVKGEQVKEVA